MARTATGTLATAEMAETADLDQKHEQMDNNHLNQPPRSPDEGIDSDDGKDHEYENSGGKRSRPCLFIRSSRTRRSKFSKLIINKRAFFVGQRLKNYFGLTDTDNALGMNEPNFCTPMKDDNSVFKVPNPRVGKIRPFVRSEDDDLTRDSPLRKKQMPNPLMSSTPLGRPEIIDANGPKFGVEGMRQNGLPVKNLFSDFSSCADGDMIGDSTLEDPNLSLVGSDIDSDAPPKGSDYSYLLNSSSECGLGNAPDALNHKITLDDSDVDKETYMKPPSTTPVAGTASKSVWSLEEQLRLLKLGRTSPLKTANEVFSSPEYEKNGPNESDGGVSAPKRKRGDCSMDSGVFEHDSVHKHHARERMSLETVMGMETDAGSDVDEIQRRVDSVLIE